MRLSLEDQWLLKELCKQQDVSHEKVRQLLTIEQDYEFKDRRTGIYDALREVLKSKPTTEPGERNEP